MNVTGFCDQASDVLGFIGWILTVFKIAIPLLIIGYGMFDLGKAVVGSKDDDIKVASKRLMYRAIAGVLIFFVPTVVMWLFGTINGYKDMPVDNFKKCQDCILRPWNCD